MSKRPLYECAMRIGQLSDNAPFVEWLKDTKQEHLGALSRLKDDVELRQVQGRVQQLDDILGLLDSAPAVLTKLLRDQ